MMVKTIQVTENDAQLILQACDISIRQTGLQGNQFFGLASRVAELLQHQSDEATAKNVTPISKEA